MQPRPAARSRGRHERTDRLLAELRRQRRDDDADKVRLQREVQRAREARDQSLAELRRGAELRERFIGVLAHDLRTPLQAITCTAGMLLKQHGVPESCRQALQRVLSATDRMSRMITDLLDATRFRQGVGICLQKAPVDLAEIVRRVVHELEAAHPRRRIVVSELGDTRCEADADRIAQVVSNLGSNAVAYSAEGSTVEIEVRGEPEELVLAVHNEGEPIAPDILAQIFKPFVRGRSEGEGAPAPHGLGLGLFIALEIARAHGGDAHVTSTAAAGTTFEVHLPRSAREPQNPQRAPCSEI